MKRKEYKTGFVLQRAFCDVCKFESSSKGSFHELKEDLIWMIQDMHNRQKPTACNGKLND